MSIISADSTTIFHNLCFFAESASKPNIRFLFLKIVTDSLFVELVNGAVIFIFRENSMVDIRKSLYYQKFLEYAIK